MICIGAGAGNETNYLIEKGYEVWALDPSSSSMDYIKNRTPENRLDKLHLLQSKLVASFFGDKFTGFDKKDAVNMTWLTEKRVEGMLSKFDIKLFKINLNHYLVDRYFSI